MKKSLKKYTTTLIIFLLAIWIGIALASGPLILWWKSWEEKISHTWKINATATAYFAGWCFWCMESIFEKQYGVEWAYVWYTGGQESTATYKQTSDKNTKHREAVRVEYDPEIISYKKLLELFWTQIDPTDEGGQFNDRGFVYSTAIFYNDADEKTIAEESKKNLQESGRFESDIATIIEPMKPFYDAEDYHQDYYKNNSVRYKLYTSGSGRKWFIETNWQDRIDYLEGKKYIKGEWIENKSTAKYSEEDLRTRLTPLQYKVTQEMWTERSFDNEYWDNKEAGIYVDIVDGTPLYSSIDKFDSGTGWPSFTKWISEDNFTIHTDTRFFLTRTEVRSASADSHLGHIFNDAPAELWGIRHCINSAALKFIPVDKLIEEGYEEYVEMFN